jgi:hypothetical protein
MKVSSGIDGGSEFIIRLLLAYPPPDHNEANWRNLTILVSNDYKPA